MCKIISWSSGSRRASRPPARRVAGSPLAPPAWRARTERPKIRPCPGRRTSSRVRTQQDTTRTNQQVRAGPLPDRRRHGVQVRRSRASRDLGLGPHVHTASPTARPSVSRWTSIIPSTASRLMRPKTELTVQGARRAHGARGARSGTGGHAELCGPDHLIGRLGR
jgi:hypothetical protein